MTDAASRYSAEPPPLTPSRSTSLVPTIKDDNDSEPEDHDPEVDSDVDDDPTLADGHEDDPRSPMSNGTGGRRKRVSSPTEQHGDVMPRLKRERPHGQDGSDREDSVDSAGESEVASSAGSHGTMQPGSPAPSDLEDTKGTVDDSAPSPSQHPVPGSLPAQADEYQVRLGLLEGKFALLQKRYVDISKAMERELRVTNALLDTMETLEEEFEREDSHGR